MVVIKSSIWQPVQTQLCVLETSKCVCVWSLGSVIHTFIEGVDFSVNETEVWKQHYVWNCSIHTV